MFDYIIKVIEVCMSVCVMVKLNYRYNDFNKYM